MGKLAEKDAQLYIQSERDFQLALSTRIPVSASPAYDFTIRFACRVNTLSNFASEWQAAAAAGESGTPEASFQQILPSTILLSMHVKRKCLPFSVARNEERAAMTELFEQVEFLVTTHRLPSSL